jgi:hypothetical protein
MRHFNGLIITPYLDLVPSTSIAPVFSCSDQAELHTLSLDISGSGDKRTAILTSVGLLFQSTLVDWHIVMKVKR